MTYGLRAGCVWAALCWGAVLSAAEGPEPKWTLPLWTGTAPGETGKIPAEGAEPQRPGQKEVHRVNNVTVPQIQVFPAPADKANGTAVVICPGGGYSILAWDLEGTEVAAWLNSLGVTGIVLKYRVPKREGRPKHEAPLQDAQRALRLSRAHAKAWGIDPNRLGILGFSAGGHLAATTSTNDDRPAYPEGDEFDKLSAKPDFAVLVYPAYLVEKGALAPEIRVTPKTPPTILIHAGDDRISPENSARMYLALKETGVPAELHIYSKGGHGYGLRPSADAVSTWPDRCAAWFKAQGLLEPAKAAK